MAEKLIPEDPIFSVERRIQLRDRIRQTTLQAQSGARRILGRIEQDARVRDAQDGWVTAEVTSEGTTAAPASPSSQPPAKRQSFVSIVTGLFRKRPTADAASHTEQQTQVVVHGRSEEVAKRQYRRLLALDGPVLIQQAEQIARAIEGQADISPVEIESATPCVPDLSLLN